MTTALLVSNLLLWLAVLALGALVLALLRQIGVLHERVSPAGALLVRGGPQVGEVAPVLEVEDWQGRALRVGGRDAEGRDTLLYFLSPTCPVCKTLLPVVASVAGREEKLRVVYASDGSRSEHEAFVAAQGLSEGPYVLSTPLGLAYQVAKLPHAVLIDAGGIVRASGLVNTREHLESLFEARALGVASLQEYAARQREVA